MNILTKDLEFLGLLFGVIISAISLLTGVMGAIAWFKSKATKEYAAKRDFAHLRRNYEQMNANLKALLSLIESEFKENNSELRNEITRLTGEIKVLAAKLDR